MRPLIIAALLGTSLGSQPSSAEEISKLAPSSPWNVDYSNDSCALRRRFGAEGNAVMMELRQFRPGNVYHLTVASNDIKRWNNGRLRFSIDPDDGAHTHEKALLISYANGMSGYTLQTWLASATPPAKLDELPVLSDAQRNARERAISGFTVSKGFGKPFTLATGPLDKPLEAMRTCMDELLTHWGIDARAQKTLSRPVKALEQAEWVRKVQAVYPVGKLLALENGLVRVRLIVDPEGKPSSCHIQMKAKDDDFEQAACGTMMRHARFEPALDASGKPIASYFVTSVIYRVN